MPSTRNPLFDIFSPAQESQPVQPVQPVQAGGRNPLFDIFSSSGAVQAQPQPQKTFGNFAGDVLSGAKNIAVGAGKAVGRRTSIAGESLLTGAKELFIDTPGFIIDLVNKNILNDIGVDTSQQPGIVETAGEVTGVSEFFSNPRVKKFLPIVNDKTKGEKFFGLLTKEIGVNILGTLTGLKLISAVKGAAEIKPLLRGVVKVLDKKNPGILKGLFATAKELKLAPSAISGAGSAVGIQTARSFEPIQDSPYKDLIGSLAGSIGFESLISILKTSRSLGNKVVKGLDSAQTLKETKDQLAREITDVEQARKNISETAQVQDIINPASQGEKFDPSLTQATNDPGLIIAQNEVARFNDPKNVFSEKTRRSNVALNNALNSISPSETVLDSQRVIKTKIEKFNSAMQKETDNVNKAFEEQKSILSSALDIQAGGSKIRQRAQRLIQLQRSAENKLYSSVRGDVSIDAKDAVEGAKDIVKLLLDRNENQ